MSGCDELGLPAGGKVEEMTALNAPLTRDRNRILGNLVEQHRRERVFFLRAQARDKRIHRIRIVRAHVGGERFEKEICFVRVR